MRITTLFAGSCASGDENIGQFMSVTVTWSFCSSCDMNPSIGGTGPFIETIKHHSHLKNFQAFLTQRPRCKKNKVHCQPPQSSKLLLLFFYLLYYATEFTGCQAQGWCDTALRETEKMGFFLRMEMDKRRHNKKKHKWSEQNRKCRSGTSNIPIQEYSVKLYDKKFKASMREYIT